MMTLLASKCPVCGGTSSYTAGPLTICEGCGEVLEEEAGNAPDSDAAEGEGSATDVMDAPPALIKMLDSRPRSDTEILAPTARLYGPPAEESTKKAVVPARHLSEPTRPLARPPTLPKKSPDATEEVGNETLDDPSPGLVVVSRTSAPPPLTSPKLRPPPQPRARPPEVVLPGPEVTEPGMRPGEDFLREDLFQRVTENRPGPLVEDNEITSLTPDFFPPRAEAAPPPAPEPPPPPQIPPATTEPGAPMFLDELVTSPRPSGKAPTPREATPEAAPALDVMATQPPKPLSTMRAKAGLPAPGDSRRRLPTKPATEVPVPLAPEALIPLDEDDAEPPFEPTDAVKPVLPGRLVVAPLVGRDVDATVRTQTRDLPARMRTVRSRGQKLLVVDGLSDSQAELLIGRLERVGIVADRRSKEDLADAVDLGRKLPVSTLALAALALVVIALGAGVWAFQRQTELASITSRLSAADADARASQIYAGFEAGWWRERIQELGRSAAASPADQRKLLEMLRSDTERKARRLGALR
jgi:hypothetical protein